ncbi:MAG: beta-ketoacyl-[acyl-carrier-protein] synthase family protein [Spartobacteria bacterium]
MPRRNRVVVTGMGVIAPNGTGLREFWRTLAAGESGIGPITLFDSSGHENRIAGEVKGFDPLDYMPAQWKPKRMARHTQLAYAATKMALKHGDFEPTAQKLDFPLSVCIGVSTSALDVIEKGFHELQQRGPRRVNSGVVSNCQPQAAAKLIAQNLGVETHATTLSSACPSGLDAIAMAVARIKAGDAELAIAGGADAPVTPLTVASFASAGLTATAQFAPNCASRPYDQGSASGIIAEGAGIVLLESLEHALARGATIHLEITGYSAQMDSDPDDPFSGLVHTMRLALANACRSVRDIDYLCSYGPGDPVLDAAEVKMIRRVFGAAANQLPVSSIKGATGNPLAAAGPLQLISCALAFRHGLIPPTANHDVPNAGCDLDFVPHKARKAQLRCVLINVRGLGGGNSSMVVEKFCGN